jgi:tRNA nucleotidyltransferase/poly(A) polymerase
MRTPPTTFNDFRESYRPVDKYYHARAVGGCLRDQLLEERIEGEGKECLLECTRWRVRV